MIGDNDGFLDLLKSVNISDMQTLMLLLLEDFSRSKKPSLSPIITHLRQSGRLHRNSYVSVPDPIFPRPNLKEKIAVWLCKTTVSETG